MNSGSTEYYTFSKEGEFYVTEVLGQKFGFRKWSWGEKNALSISCTNTNVMTGEMTFDNAKFNTGLIEKTVFKSLDGKFVPMIASEIDNMPAILGERLFRLTQKMNLVQSVETVNL
jgi:hypothetical protein